MYIANKWKGEAMKRNIKNIEKLDLLKKDLSELQRMSNENMNKIDSIILKFEELVRKMKGVSMEQHINKLIEELTKVRPDELSKEGLKLFNKINEIIDKNKELEEENKIIKGNYYTLCADIQMVTSELGFPEDTIIADEMVSMINENYIPVSLVEEKIEELIKEGRHYNANKIEVLQELLEKRK